MLYFIFVDLFVCFCFVSHLVYLDIEACDSVTNANRLMLFREMMVVGCDKIYYYTLWGKR
jgi:hypothetical protein